LDLIFIDGDHTYEGAIRDMAVGWGKIRPGAWMLGHDCLPHELAASTNEKDGSPNGVRRAVEEFISQHRVEAYLLELTNYMFVIQKPIK
jgi:predicted O-methyltransferase YrrM